MKSKTPLLLCKNSYHKCFKRSAASAMIAASALLMIESSVMAVPINTDPSNEVASQDEINITGLEAANHPKSAPTSKITGTDEVIAVIAAAVIAVASYVAYRNGYMRSGDTQDCLTPEGDMPSRDSRSPSLSEEDLRGHVVNTDPLSFELESQELDAIVPTDMNELGERGNDPDALARAEKVPIDDLARAATAWMRAAKEEIKARGTDDWARAAKEEVEARGELDKMVEKNEKNEKNIKEEGYETVPRQ